MILAIAGLSSCAGYTSSAKTQPSDPGAGILSPGATSVSFGSVAVGNTATQSLTVTNTGLGTVTIASAALTGAGFTVVGGNPAGTIGVGQSSTIQIQFAPTSAGAVNGSLTIFSDASNSPLAISITGTGTQAGLTIAPVRVDVWKCDRRTERHAERQTDEQWKLQCDNQFGDSGRKRLRNHRTVSADDVDGGTKPLVQRAICADSERRGDGSITFTDNAPGSPQVLSMVGTGVATNSTLVANPGSVAFGNVSVGSSSPQTITLTNTGNASATISAISATGTGFSATGLSVPVDTGGEPEHQLYRAICADQRWRRFGEHSYHQHREQSYGVDRAQRNRRAGKSDRESSRASISAACLWAPADR